MAINSSLMLNALTRNASIFGGNRLQQEQAESGTLQNDPFESVARARTRYSEAGLTPPEPKKTTTLLQGLLNVLDIPGNVVRGALEEGFTPGGKNAIQGAVSGFTHEKTYSVGTWLKRAGVKNKLVQGVGGFIGDVLLDPTTYIGGGAVKSFGAAAMKGAGKKIGMEYADDLTRKLVGKFGAAAETKLAAAGVAKGDDIFQIGAKVVGDTPTAGNVMTNVVEKQAGAKAAQGQTKGALDAFRGSVQSMAGGRVKDKQAMALGDLLTLNPNADPITLQRVLGRSTNLKPKNSAEWQRIYNEFDTRFGTHIGKNPLDPAAAAEARAIIRSMTPEQLNSAFSVVDVLGSEIIGAKEVAGFNRVKTILTNLSDPGKVADVSEKFSLYQTAVNALGDAKYELDLANGLKVALNNAGNRRIIGIQLPFSKNIMPLADITKIVKKADPVRDFIYSNVPGIKAVSDWWDKAIRGDAPWELVQQGKDYEYAGAMDVIKRFGRVKGALPLHMEGFMKNMFGAEFMDAKMTKIQRALPYLIEGDAVIDDMPAYHSYMKELLTPVGVKGSLDIAALRQEIGEDSARRLDELANAIGELSPEEYVIAQNMAARVQVCNDTIFMLEDAMGLDDMYEKLGGEYNPNYVYHIYDASTEVAPPKNFVRISPAKSSLRNTSGTSAIFHSRDYKTLAHAVATGAELRPIDNIITIQAMRMSETIKHGIHKSIVDGIDRIHGLDDLSARVAKGVNLDTEKPLTEAVKRTVTETNTYPLTAAEAATRKVTLESKRAAVAKRLADIEASVKNVRYDAADFNKRVERGQNLLDEATRMLAKATTPEKKAAIEAKIEGLNRYLDNLRKNIDDVTSGKVKPKRGRPTKEQIDLREQYFLKQSEADKRVIYHSSAGDIEVQIEAVVPSTVPGGEPMYYLRGMRSPVTAAEISKKPRMETPGPKPWEDVRVNVEYTPQQAARKAEYEGKLSGLDAELANPSPTKTRTVQREVTDIRDIEGRAREDAVSAREAQEATLAAFKEAVGGGEGLLAFKQMFLPKEQVTMAMKASKQYVPVDDVFGIKDKYYVHKDLKPAMELFRTTFTEGEGMSDLMELYDTATRYLKIMQTTLNPSFVPRNLIGEAAMSILHGTKPESFMKGQEVLNLLGGTVTVGTKKMYNTEAVLKLRMLRPGDMVKVNGVDKSAQKALEEMIAANSVEIGGKMVYIEDLFANFVRTGLGQAGMITETLSEDIPNVIKRLENKGKIRTMGAEFTQDLRGKKLTENFALALPRLYKNIMKGASEWTEQSFRMADYIEDLAKGMDYDEAAKQVKMFHVDYADLTAFEKTVMRRVVPYYTFMRKNLPMQMRLLVEKPGYYSAIGHLVNNASNALGAPTAPDYLQQNLALPIFEDDDGTITYLNWNLPLTDLSRFSNDWNENWKQAVGSLTPFLRVPFEMATGETVMYGGKITNAPQYIASNLGGLNVLYKMLTGANAPEGEGEYAQPGQMAGFSSLFPNKNPSQEELKKMYEYSDQLQEDMRRRKAKGQDIPGIRDTQSGSYENSPAYRENKKKYTAPHER